jgi:hypothetical protein
MVARNADFCREASTAISRACSTLLGRRDQLRHVGYRPGDAHDSVGGDDPLGPHVEPAQPAVVGSVLPIATPHRLARLDASVEGGLHADPVVRMKIAHRGRSVAPEGLRLQAVELVKRLGAGDGAGRHVHLPGADPSDRLGSQ